MSSEWFENVCVCACGLVDLPASTELRVSAFAMAQE